MEKQGGQQEYVNQTISVFIKNMQTELSGETIILQNISDLFGV